MKLVVSALAALVVAAPATAVTTLDFEIGSGVVGTLSGVTFSGAVYQSCNGGCPAPINGQFVSSVDFSAPLRATFVTAQSAVSFVNVSFSSVTATAYDVANTVVDRLTNISGDAPTAPLTLSGTGIRYVVFADAGINYGIDNLTFDDAVAAVVPEASTWAMLTAGLALTGAGLRRRRSVPMVPARP